MPSNSEIILSAYTHNGDSSLETVTGGQFKGDGYFSRADGLHTVQYNFTGFIGTLKVQATLASTPTDSDWFDVTEATHEVQSSANDAQRTTSVLYNFTGNYIWIRAVVDFNDGTVNSITLNH